MSVGADALRRFVTDWGGFEDFIATLHRTGRVTVQRDVTLTGRSGAPRQIDVLVTHEEGLYRHQILVECKYWNKRVERTHIDAMITAVGDLNASKGVFFTTVGYQSGAETMARERGIDIFVVRDLTQDEWGPPGKVIDIYMQILQRSLGNYLFHGATVIGPPEPVTAVPPAISLNFKIGGPDDWNTKTRIFNPATPQRAADTLEEFLERVSLRVFQEATTVVVTFNQGAKCTAYLVAPVDLPFEPPLQVEHESGWILCPRITFDVGIKIDQSRFVFDRESTYVYAIAVENCANGAVFSASRRHNTEHGDISPHHTKTSSPADEGEALKNGSVLRVYMKTLFPFSELEGKQRVDRPELSPKPPG